MLWLISCAATSQSVCALPNTCSKIQVMPFSNSEQSSFMLAMPPTPPPRPIMSGEPEMTASRCGTLPGSWSVTSTLNGEYWSRMQVKNGCQAAAPFEYGGMSTVEDAMLETLVRESSLFPAV